MHHVYFRLGQAMEKAKTDVQQEHNYHWVLARTSLMLAELVAALSLPSPPASTHI